MTTNRYNKMIDNLPVTDPAILTGKPRGTRQLTKK